MPSHFQIRQAADIINKGGVIAYPTESVYGLGCNPLDSQAVSDILLLKQRPIEKGMIIIGGSLEQLEPYTELDADNRKKILEEKSPTTWLVNKSSLTPYWVSGEHNKIAIRLSSHPVVKALCKSAGMAIISTSANPADHPSATNSLKVRQYFNNQLDYILSGETGYIKTATPIVDIDSMNFIRG